jgi:hypothetical protein
MKTPDTKSSSPRARPARADCCIDSECESGLRNNYFVGKRLTPDAFRVEQRYQNQRRHLVNRAIHGWGVVYGYPVAAEPADKARKEGTFRRFVVGPGFALDLPGRELLQVDSVSLGLDDVIALDNDFKRIPTGCECGKEHPAPWRGGCWLLSVHYAEQPVGAVDLRDPCSCERHEWDKVCETVRYSLRHVDCAACCGGPECELDCGCSSSPCCNEMVLGVVEKREAERCGGANPVLRGGCACLCEHLTALRPEPACHDLTEIREACGRVRVDLRHGVPLACLMLVNEEKGECPGWRFSDWIESCGPRRLVKRNDVLFDLLQGCDLARISDIGWKQWHRTDEPMPWNSFERSWGTEKEPGKHFTILWWVEFSHPIRENTVRPDCFSVYFMDYDEDTAWGQARYLPIVDVTTWAAPGTPDKHITRATLVVDSAWFHEAVAGRRTIFDDRIQMVIEVNGNYMIDCNGQAPDLDNVGLPAAPTGNGSPGGIYRSHVLIERRRGKEDVPRPEPGKPPIEKDPKSDGPDNNPQGVKS